MEQVLVCPYCDERVTDGIAFGSDMMHKHCHQAFGEEMARIYRGEFEPVAAETIEAFIEETPDDEESLLVAFAEAFDALEGI